MRSARPEILLLLATSIPDDKLLLEKLNEFGLGKGRLPVIANGAHIGAPELLKTVGKELMEGVMFIVANWPSKGQEQIVEDFKKETGEPWMTQDSLCTYGDVWIMKEALETAGKADRRAVSAEDDPEVGKAVKMVRLMVVTSLVSQCATLAS